jgi:hypothetical protein
VTVSHFKVDSFLAGTTGDAENSNVSFGYQALSNPSTTLNYNVAVGRGALFFNSSGFANTAHGGEALYSNTGGYFNTANGWRALYYNTSGHVNTANGNWALFNNTEGNDNTATGGEALYQNTTGSYNTAHGTYSLPHNTTGEDNTANGHATLADNTTGFCNTSSGAWALRFNTTGSFNTAMGYYTTVNEGDLNNTTAIGYEAIITSSNQTRIGNSSVNSIGGYADWTNFSDGRAKKNIRMNVPGLNFINRLQPVTFNLDLDVMDGLLNIDKTKRQGEEELSPELIGINKKAREAKEKVKQTGFIAQDVEEVAKSIGYDFSGVDVDEAGIYGLRYAEFVVPLVKAVQELSVQVNELTALVDSLRGKEPESGALRSAIAGESATGLQDAADSGASLQQNTPNPFNQSTVIRYTLPQTGKPAQMVISNTAGTIVRQILLSGGTSSITIEGGALSAGVYYYSLYVGNRLIDTKQMILTKTR